MSLKDNWKATGAGFGQAFKELGKTLIKTASTAAEKADRWANGKDEPSAEAPKDTQP